MSAQRWLTWPLYVVASRVITEICRVHFFSPKCKLVVKDPTLKIWGHMYVLHMYVLCREKSIIMPTTKVWGSVVALGLGNYCFNTSTLFYLNSNNKRIIVLKGFLIMVSYLPSLPQFIHHFLSKSPTKQLINNYPLPLSRPTTSTLLVHYLG